MFIAVREGGEGRGERGREGEGGREWGGEGVRGGEGGEGGEGRREGRGEGWEGREEVWRGKMGRSEGVKTRDWMVFGREKGAVAGIMSPPPPLIKGMLLSYSIGNTIPGHHEHLNKPMNKSSPGSWPSAASLSCSRASSTRCSDCGGVSSDDHQPLRTLGLLSFITAGYVVCMR